MQTESLSLNPLLVELLKQYSPILSLEAGAALLGLSSQNAVRIAFSRGKLPVRIRIVAGKQCFFLSDIAQFLSDGLPQNQILAVRQKGVNQTPQVAGKRGRPSKGAQIAARQSNDRGVA